MDELTKKQKGFVKDYVETGNGVQSALNNYDTDDYSTAGAIASENLNKPKVINAIKSIAEYFTEEELAKVHLEGLKATKGDEPDYAVRHKYLDSAYKIKGLYEADNQRNINVLMPVLVKFLDKKDDKENETFE